MKSYNYLWKSEQNNEKILNLNNKINKIVIKNYFNLLATTRNALTYRNDCKYEKNVFAVMHLLSGGTG